MFQKHINKAEQMLSELHDEYMSLGSAVQHDALSLEEANVEADALQQRMEQQLKLIKRLQDWRFVLYCLLALTLLGILGWNGMDKAHPFLLTLRLLVASILFGGWLCYSFHHFKRHR